jgi:hypothetical protein
MASPANGTADSQDITDLRKLQSAGAVAFRNFLLGYDQDKDP